MKKNILATLAVFLLPIALTTVYSITEASIGPMVLIYSIISGVFLGIIWARPIRKKCSILLTAFLGVIIGLGAAVLTLNFFILVTHTFGNSDYYLI